MRFCLMVLSFEVEPEARNVALVNIGGRRQYLRPPYGPKCNDYPRRTLLHCRRLREVAMCPRVLMKLNAVNLQKKDALLDFHCI